MTEPWIEQLKQLETSRDWPISWEKRLNQQISVSGFRTIKYSTIEPVCTSGCQTFSVFLDSGKTERPLKLNFTSIDYGQTEKSPVALSVQKLHQLRSIPSEFEEDIRSALNISSSSLTNSGNMYLLTCMPEWFTFEQMACIFRHPCVIDVELSINAVYIQFVRQTDSTSSLRVIKQRRPDLFTPKRKSQSSAKKTRSFRRNKVLARA